MILSKEKMHESGTIDYVTLLGAIEEIKHKLPSIAGKKQSDYSVLLFDSVYFILDYTHYPEHTCPTRYNLLQTSDVVFRLMADQIEVLKNRLSSAEMRDIFERRGIHVYRMCNQIHIDEE